MTSSWFFLSTLNYDARSTAHQNEIWMATWNVLSLNRAGSLRKRWMDDMREGLRRMGVTDWRICAHRRDDWKMVVKEAKVLQGL